MKLGCRVTTRLITFLRRQWMKNWRQKSPDVIIWKLKNEQQTTRNKSVCCYNDITSDDSHRARSFCVSVFRRTQPRETIHVLLADTSDMKLRESEGSRRSNIRQRRKLTTQQHQTRFSEEYWNVENSFDSMHGLKAGQRLTVVCSTFGFISEGALKDGVSERSPFFV